MAKIGVYSKNEIDNMITGKIDVKIDSIKAFTEWTEVDPPSDNTIDPSKHLGKVFLYTPVNSQIVKIYVVGTIIVNDETVYHWIDITGLENYFNGKITELQGTLNTHTTAITKNENDIATIKKPVQEGGQQIYYYLYNGQSGNINLGTDDNPFLVTQMSPLKGVIVASSGTTVPTNIPQGYAFETIESA